MPCLRAAAAFVVIVLGPLPVRAGLYSVEEPPKGGPIPRGLALDRFQRDQLTELRRLPIDKSFDLRKKYEKRIDELSARKPLTVEDQINLSFYHIRIGQPAEALKLLRGIDSRGARHFMVLANLATAHLMLAGAGDNPRLNLGSARYYLKQTLKAWPKTWPGWTAQNLQAYHEAELLQLKLIEARLAELVGTQGAPRAYSRVDALFPVRFDAKDGKYRAGKPPQSEEGKLTGKEIASTKQLLTWLPGDNRLYWLMGELANATGDFQTAESFLDELVYKQNLAIPLLKDHWQVVREAKQSQARQPAPEPAAGWLPDFWQMVIVGGIGGLIVVILAYFQIREIRRRRGRAPPVRSRS